MLPRLPYVRETSLCAVILASLVGCRSGLIKKPMGLADKDPFLDAIDTDSTGPKAAQPTRSNLDGIAERFAKSVRDKGTESRDDQFRGVFEADRGRSESPESTESIDVALFENEPEQALDDSKSSGLIKQSGFQADLPPSPYPAQTIELPDSPDAPPSSVINSGLGPASPWGDAPDDSDLDISLSFEDSDVPEEPMGPDDFTIDLEELDSGSLPSDNNAGEGDQTAASDSRWGRFNIFNRGNEPEPNEPEADKPRQDRPSIRDRFSKLGARFGLTDEEERPAEDVSQKPSQPSGTADCMEELIERTQAKIEGLSYTRLGPIEREAYLRDHVNLRLFYLANNQHERALDAIPGIPPAEQEFWQQIFWSLSQYRNSDAVPDRTERITQTVAQLRAALQRLQETAKLQLSNVSFCRRISGYGSYERFAKDSFEPGDPVLVYAEIENFRSEPTASGEYRTLLRSSLQIVPENGTDPVDSVKLKPVEDVCRNPRRDYFNSYEFTIPGNIEPGRYRLEINVDDELSGKSSTQSIVFSVR